MLAIVLCLLTSLPLALQNYGITSFITVFTISAYVQKHAESLLEFYDPSRINTTGTVSRVVNYIV
jgi:hypothetical protein